MNFLEERIVKDGVVKEGNILKVDSFLNHQMDINLFDQMGEEFKRRFADKPINKIVTIEASGIGIAALWHVISAFRSCLQRRPRASTSTARFMLPRLNPLRISVRIRLSFLRSSSVRTTMCCYR